MLSRRHVLLGTAAVMAAPSVALAARRELEGDTDFHVSPAGDDSNDGLTAPKRTIAAMYRELQSNWDLRGFQATIRCASGEYEDTGLYGPLVGMAQPLRIVGSLERGACVIKGETFGFYADDAKVLIEGFTITAGSMGLVSTNRARVEYRDIEFGPCGSAHVAAEKGGVTYALCLRQDGSKADYFISGPSPRHLYVNGGGIAFLTEMVTGNGITFLAPLRFTMFADVIQGGNLTAHTNKWSGPPPKGAALYVRWHSVAAFASHLPGDQDLNVCDPTSTSID